MNEDRPVLSVMEL